MFNDTWVNVSEPIDQTFNLIHNVPLRIALFSGTVFNWIRYRN